MKRKKTAVAGLSKMQKKIIGIKSSIGIKSNASPSSKPKQQNHFEDDDELSQINEKLGRTKLQSSEKKPAF